MVVEWALKEAEKSQAIVMVDVSELGLEMKGKKVKELPAMDIVGEEYYRWQRAPEVLRAPGELNDVMSEKSQALSIVIAIARLKKADPGLQLEYQWLVENWTMSKILRLTLAVSRAFGEVEKNLEDSESPKQDNLS